MKKPGIKFGLARPKGGAAGAADPEEDHAASSSVVNLDGVSDVPDNIPHSADYAPIAQMGAAELRRDLAQKSFSEKLSDWLSCSTKEQSEQSVVGAGRSAKEWNSNQDRRSGQDRSPLVHSLSQLKWILDNAATVVPKAHIPFLLRRVGQPIPETDSWDSCRNRSRFAASSTTDSRAARPPTTGGRGGVCSDRSRFGARRVDYNQLESQQKQHQPVVGEWFVSAKLVSEDERRAIMVRAREVLRARLDAELAVNWRKDRIELPDHVKKINMLWLHKPRLPEKLQTMSRHQVGKLLQEISAGQAPCGLPSHSCRDRDNVH